MSSSDRRITARSVTDLLAAVPYLLGFHPADSLVALGLHGTRLVFAARCDLPTLDPNANPTIEHDAEHDIDAGTSDHTLATSEALEDFMAQRGITAVAFVGYGPAERVDPAMTAAITTFTARAMPIVEAVRVADGRYFSYTCPNPTCCPPGGTVFDPDHSSIPAAAVYAGQIALPDRDAVVAQVVAQEGPGRDAILAATARARRRLTRLIGAGTNSSTRNLDQARRRLTQAGTAAIDQALDRHRNGGCLTDDETAWLSVLLTDTEIRNLAGDRIDDQPEHLALWCDLTRRASEDVVAAPASLAAYTAWQLGNGVLAVAAVQRALTADPHDQLASVLADLFSHGIPPTALERGPRPDEITRAHQPTPSDDAPGHSSSDATDVPAEEDRA